MKNIEDDSTMIRLTACVSGRVQRVGYRAKIVSLANEMDLVGIDQNRPDGSLLVIAEGEEKDKLERFASAIAIKNALIGFSEELRMASKTLIPSPKMDSRA